VTGLEAARLNSPTRDRDALSAGTLEESLFFAATLVRFGKSGLSSAAALGAGLEPFLSSAAFLVGGASGSSSAFRTFLAGRADGGASFSAFRLFSVDDVDTLLRRFASAAAGGNSLAGPNLGAAFETIFADSLSSSTYFLDKNSRLSMDAI
jgi:hypothetical protein